MPMSPSYSKVAGGTIAPSVFVKLDPNNAGQVLQAGVGDQTFGIAQEGTRLPPFGGLDDGNAAIITENIKVYGPPAKDVFLAMNAACNAGVHLKAATGGLGTPVTGTSDIAGAISQEPCPGAGYLIRVEVIFPTNNFTV